MLNGCDEGILNCRQKCYLIRLSVKTRVVPEYRALHCPTFNITTGCLTSMSHHTAIFKLQGVSQASQTITGVLKRPVSYYVRCVRCYLHKLHLLAAIAFYYFAMCFSMYFNIFANSKEVLPTALPGSGRWKTAALMSVLERAEMVIRRWRVADQSRRFHF